MVRRINGIPAIGFGTWRLTGPDGQQAIGQAIRLGYRHIDTAQSYGTEHDTGAAIAASGLDRKDLFVTTKITMENLLRLEESLDESLAIMGLDYVDLTLIHWPVKGDVPPVTAYIGDLAKAADNGKTRLIGVSNFTRRHVDEAIGEIGEGRLATNQVERHVLLQNHVLADHCAAHGIAMTAYQPIGGGNLGDEPELNRIAAKHHATPSQIALAYLLELDCIVIPKSASAQRQEENLRFLDIELDDEDLASLRKLDRGERRIDPPSLAPDWD